MRFGLLGLAATLVLLSGCGGEGHGSDAGTDSPAERYVPGMVKPTARGLFTVAFWSEPGPPAVGMNTMTLAITDSGTGAPVAGAFVKLVPYMPTHGHGSNTIPGVVETAQPGVYRAELVELQMRGLWELRVQVNTIDQTDTVVFAFDVP